MIQRLLQLLTISLSLAVALRQPTELRAASAQILGWNNLGMHCMDSDYSVFSILPPYNTIEAQLIVGGKLVTNGSGYTVTYQAVADPGGSFNSTAMGKGNFYDLRHRALRRDARRGRWARRLVHARHQQHAAGHAVRNDQQARAGRGHAGELVSRRGHSHHALRRCRTRRIRIR